MVAGRRSGLPPLPLCSSTARASAPALTLHLSMRVAHLLICELSRLFFFFPTLHVLSYHFVARLVA